MIAAVYIIVLLVEAYFWPWCQVSTCTRCRCMLLSDSGMCFYIVVVYVLGHVLEELRLCTYDLVSGACVLKLYTE